MREILFRGKRLDNGAWVKGAFCLKDCDDPFGEMKDIPSIIKYDPPCDGFWFRVDPETVGQFTGEYDRKGKRIYEGDIVTMPGYSRFGLAPRHTAVVYFRKGKFAVDGSQYKFKDIGAKNMEVIGNIHDNPELLENK